MNFCSEICDMRSFTDERTMIVVVLLLYLPEV